jgi:hypothetical protein
MICNSNGIDDMHGFAVILPAFKWVFFIELHKSKSLLHSFSDSAISSERVSAEKELSPLVALITRFSVW